MLETEVLGRVNINPGGDKATAEMTRNARSDYTATGKLFLSLTWHRSLFLGINWSEYLVFFVLDSKVPHSYNQLSKEIIRALRGAIPKKGKLGCWQDYN